MSIFPSQLSSCASVKWCLMRAVMLQVLRFHCLWDDRKALFGDR